MRTFTNKDTGDLNLLTWLTQVYQVEHNSTLKHNEAVIIISQEN